MTDQIEKITPKRWYNHALVTSTTSLLVKSGLLLGAGLLVLYAGIRASAVLDAPIVSLRTDKYQSTGISYNLPLRIESVSLEWTIEACEYDAIARAFNVAMSISRTTHSSIIPDPTLAYRIDRESLLNWAYSSSMGITLSESGFIEEFVLNSVADVVDTSIVQPGVIDLRAVQIPPQGLPGLTLSVEDQCGSAVASALKLKQAAEGLSSEDPRREIQRAMANSVLSHSEARRLVPRFEKGKIGAEGTGLVRAFPDTTKLGPVTKMAAELLSIEVAISSAEPGQLPAEAAPESADGIVFRTPGLAEISFCFRQCRPGTRGDGDWSSVEPFPQLGRYTVIPIVRRPFSTLAIAISADSQGVLKSVHMGERQQVPGRDKAPEKEGETAPYEIEQLPASPEDAPSN